MPRAREAVETDVLNQVTSPEGESGRLHLIIASLLINSVEFHCCVGVSVKGNVSLQAAYSCFLRQPHKL